MSSFNTVRDLLATQTAFASNIDASSGTNWPPPGEYTFFVKAVQFAPDVEFKWKNPSEGSCPGMTVTLRFELEQPLPGEAKPREWFERYLIVPEPHYSTLPPNQKERVDLAVARLRGAYSVILDKPASKSSGQAFFSELEALDNLLSSGKAVVVRGNYVEKKSGAYTNRDTYIKALIAN